MSLDYDRQALIALAKERVRPTAARVFASATENAAGRFPVTMEESEAGYAIFGHGDEAMAAEYGRTPDDQGDRWASRAVMGGADGRP